MSTDRERLVLAPDFLSWFVASGGSIAPALDRDGAEQRFGFGGFRLRESDLSLAQSLQQARDSQGRLIAGTIGPGIRASDTDAGPQWFNERSTFVRGGITYRRSFAGAVDPVAHVTQNYPQHLNTDQFIYDPEFGYGVGPQLSELFRRDNLASRGFWDGPGPFFLAAGALAIVVAPAVAAAAAAETTAAAPVVAPVAAETTVAASEFSLAGPGSGVGIGGQTYGLGLSVEGASAFSTEFGLAGTGSALGLQIPAGSAALLAPALSNPLTYTDLAIEGARVAQVVRQGQAVKSALDPVLKIGSALRAAFAGGGDAPAVAGANSITPGGAFASDLVWTLGALAAAVVAVFILSKGA